jgi:hypothetical protein
VELVDFGAGQLRHVALDLVARIGTPATDLQDRTWFEVSTGSPNFDLLGKPHYDEVC